MKIIDQNSIALLTSHGSSEIGHQLNFMNGKRMVGRKPVNFKNAVYLCVNY